MPLVLPRSSSKHALEPASNIPIAPIDLHRDQKPVLGIYYGEGYLRGAECVYKSELEGCIETDMIKASWAEMR